MLRCFSLVLELISLSVALASVALAAPGQAIQGDHPLPSWLESKKSNAGAYGYLYRKCEREGMNVLISLIAKNAEVSEQEVREFGLSHFLSTEKGRAASSVVMLDHGASGCTEARLESFEVLKNIAALVKAIDGRLLESMLTRAQLLELSEAMTLCNRMTRSRHLDAMIASQRVYDLEAPNGFKEIARFDDTRTGFKAMIVEKSRPGLDGRKLRMVVFAGTEDRTDAIADLKFGIEQYKKNFAAVDTLVQKSLNEGYDVLFTGHSLGGGLAQAFAFQSELNQQQKSVNAPFKSGRIETVTWNAFGGKDLIALTNHVTEEMVLGKRRNWMPARVKGELGSASIRLPGVIDSVHYRMEGDPVSRISSHFGEVREIPQFASKRATPSESRKGVGSLAPSHAQMNFIYEQMSVLEARDSGIASARPATVKPLAPALSGAVSWLVEVQNGFEAFDIEMSRFLERQLKRISEI